jgi:hypothetical protein
MPAYPGPSQHGTVHIANGDHEVGCSIKALRGQVRARDFLADAAGESVALMP